MLHRGMLGYGGVDQERVTSPANWLTIALYCRSAMPVYQEPVYGMRKKVSVRNPDGQVSASLTAHLGIEECHDDRMRRYAPISSANSNTILLLENP